MVLRSFCQAFFSAVAGLCLFGACTDWAWSSLYGEDCDGELIAQGEECVILRCGDGVVSTGEQCDDANLDDTDGCLSTCVLPACGDGVVWAASEDCDDGNLEDGDGCSRRCRKESQCGDGEISGFEMCDDGGTEPGDGCAPDCLIEPDPVACGNGALDEAEVCDDGNTDSHDSCLSGCTWSSCGDGVVRRGVEECEDGNANNGDGCTRSCIPCGEEGTRHRIGNDHCYVFHDDWIPYQDAYNACADAGGYLWTAASAGETREIERNLVPDNLEVWLGLGKEDGNHFWITGEASKYRPWIADHPSGQGCTTQFGTETKSENFMSRSCGAKRPYVCEFEPALIDPESHKAYRRFFTNRTLAGAGALCVEAGGELLGLETVKERDFVFGAFPNDYWLGASRDLTGSFEWLSGKAVSEEVLDGADTSGADVCLMHAGGGFVVSACEEERAFVCEFR